MILLSMSSLFLFLFFFFSFFFSLNNFFVYQRLEFLGDAVLDYLITTHLYDKYPGLSPGLLTDLRAASVNNDCYARSAVKAGLHKHILHASYELHKHIVRTIANFEKLSSESTFGWESETSFPKVSFLVIHTRLEQTLQVVLMFFFFYFIVFFFLPLI